MKFKNKDKIENKDVIFIRDYNTIIYSNLRKKFILM